jgi:hypothetical protein
VALAHVRGIDCTGAGSRAYIISMPCAREMNWLPKSSPSTFLSKQGYHSRYFETIAGKIVSSFFMLVVAGSLRRDAGSCNLLLCGADCTRNRKKAGCPPNTTRLQSSVEDYAQATTIAYPAGRRPCSSSKGFSQSIMDIIAGKVRWWRSLVTTFVKQCSANLQSHYSLLSVHSSLFISITRAPSNIYHHLSMAYCVDLPSPLENRFHLRHPRLPISSQPQPPTSFATHEQRTSPENTARTVRMTSFNCSPLLFFFTALQPSPVAGKTRLPRCMNVDKGWGRM